jgi:hypothetical protein
VYSKFLKGIRGAMMRRCDNEKHWVRHKSEKCRTIQLIKAKYDPQSDVVLVLVSPYKPNSLGTTMTPVGTPIWDCHICGNQVKPLPTSPEIDDCPVCGPITFPTLKQAGHFYPVRRRDFEAVLRSVAWEYRGSEIVMALDGKATWNEEMYSEDITCFLLRVPE